MLILSIGRDISKATKYQLNGSCYQEESGGRRKEMQENTDKREKEGKEEMKEDRKRYKKPPIDLDICCSVIPAEIK